MSYATMITTTTPKRRGVIGMTQHTGVLRVLLIALVALILGAGAPGAWANDDDDDDDDTICKQTADKMFQSCRFEINEEFKATIASCINIADNKARGECLDTAAATKKEDRKGCGDQREARKDVCDLLGENRYDPDPLTDKTIQFIADPDDRNPYFNLKPGHTYVLRGGEGFEETTVVHVTNEVREIQGVKCRFVVDVVLLSDDGDYVAVEVTDDYYAQSKTGDVYYCGETARNFEDGILVNLDGSFEAGRNFAKAGILIKANPQTGDAHRQEWSLGEAEDVIQYVAGADKTTAVGDGERGDNPKFPCAGSCVKTEEFIPPDPGAGEFKYFLAGTGFVLGVELEDGVPTGVRDELVCVGASLDILADPSCGIAKPAALLEKLCKLSPDAFCQED